MNFKVHGARHLFLVKTSLLFLVNASLFFLLFEMSSQFFLYDFIDFKVKNSLTSIDQEFVGHLPIEQTLKDYDYSGKHPHPYFGFVKDRFEKYNFERYEIYHLKKSANSFNIGIFGGSVAQGLFEFNDRNRVLHQKLKKRALQLAKKKSGADFMIVEFAKGGGKQPEQLNISALYGEGLDIAVNVEGVNELSNFHHEKFPPYFPIETVSKFYFSGLKKMRSVTLLINLLEWKYSVKQRLIQDRYWLKSHKTVDLFIYYQINKWLLKLQLENDSVPRHRFYGNDLHGELKHSLKENLKQWVKLSCLQQNILLSQGTRSLFFIQPFPQFAKKLSIAEQGLPYDDSEKEKRLRKFLKDNEFLRLRESGLNVISLLSIFQNESETIYVDSCCHMNKKGNQMILEAMAEEIEKSLTNRPRFCHLEDLQKIVDKFKE